MELSPNARSTLNGVLGTIIFHLLLLLLFFGIKLHKLNIQEEDAFMIDFVDEENEPLEKIEQDIEDLKDKLNANINIEQKTNVAASIDREFSKTVSTEEYLNELLNELNIDNLHPEHNTDIPDNLQDNLNDDADQSEVNEHNKLTRINYELGDRKKLRIPQPLFMCEGGGVVVIDIEVDEQGYVINAKCSSETANADECLVREALTAARKSVFTRSSDGVKKEFGFISFEFVPQ